MGGGNHRRRGSGISVPGEFWHAERSAGVPFLIGVELVGLEGAIGSNCGKEVPRLTKRPPFCLDRSPQPGGLEGSGEFVGGLDRCLKAIGSVGFAIEAMLAHLLSKKRGA